MRRRQSDAIAQLSTRREQTLESGGAGEPDDRNRWPAWLSRSSSSTAACPPSIPVANRAHFSPSSTSLLLAFEPAKRLSRMHVDLTGNLLGVEILYSFLDEPSEEDASEQRPSLLVREGRVEYRRVEFEYRARRIGAARPRSYLGARAHHRLGGQVRRRQDDGHEHAAQVLRAQLRRDLRRRSRHSAIFPRLVAAADCLRRPGYVSLQRHHRGKHRHGPARRRPRRNRRRRQSGACAPIHFGF